MITPKLIILPLIAAFGTLALTPFIRQFSKKVGAIEEGDNERRVHKGSIPVSGGIAILLSFLVAVLFFNRTSPEILGFIIGGMVIAGVGLLDDIFEVPASFKLLGQFLAAFIAIYSGIRIDFVSSLGGGIFNLGFLALPLTFFWIIGATNAINFMDGLDGLASGVSGIAATTLGIVALLNGRYDAAVLAFILAAATFAFLPYVFSEKMKIFLGDAGAYFLGYSLGILAIIGMVKTAALFSMLIPIIVLAIPIFDTAFAIIRRLIQRKSLFQPDAGHLHHRLSNLGFTHRQTVYIIYLTSIILSCFAILSTMLTLEYSIAILLGSILLLVVSSWKIGLIRVKTENSLSKEA